MAKISAKKKKQFLWRAIVLIVLAAIMAVSFIWAEQINYRLGLTTIDEEAYTGNSTDDVLDIANFDNENAPNSSLNIHFVDVGQGDACIIELPDNKKMIIDGGKDKEKASLLNYIDEVIDDDPSNKMTDMDYAFDYAILTHSDEDHCGGIDDVLNKYGARYFYRPNVLASYKGYTDPGKNKLATPYAEHSTLAYMRALEAGYKSENPVIISADPNVEMANIITSDTTDETSEDYYKFEFYSPTKSYYKDHNDYSPIIILTYQGKRFAFSGDAENEAEKEFAKNVSEGTGIYSVFSQNGYVIDVLKLGHHGSRTSSTDEYLNALNVPNNSNNIIAIVSCGFGNSYSHPHTEVMTRLNGYGITNDRILRTDTNSTIVMTVKYDTEAGAWALFYGADVVRITRPTIQITSSISMQWIELCITVWILIAIVLIVQPFIKKNRSKIKKATGVDIAKYAPDTSKSIEKVDATINTVRKNKSTTPNNSTSSKSSSQSKSKTSTSDILSKLSGVATTVDKKTTTKKSTGTAKKSTTKSTTTKKTTTKKK